jgi:hypothetical protein
MTLFDPAIQNDCIDDTAVSRRRRIKQKVIYKI